MLYSNTHSAPTAETFLSFFWRALRVGLLRGSVLRTRFAALRIPHAVSFPDRSKVLCQLLYCIKLFKTIYLVEGYKI